MNLVGATTQPCVGKIPHRHRSAVDEVYLAAFRRIDPAKAHPLAHHFLGIAINDPGGAGHMGQGGATGFTIFCPFAGGCSNGLMPARRALLATWLSPERLLIKLFDLRRFIIG